MRLSGISNFLAIGRTRPRRKFFPQRGTACPFRSPRPDVGNIRASGAESFDSIRQASITGRTCCGTGIGALLCFVFSRPLKNCPS